MDVAEVLIYDRALGEAERLEVEAYLNEKYFGQGCCVAAQVVTDPMSQDACPGDAVSLSVSATGAAPLNYQWRHDGIDLDDPELYHIVDSFDGSVAFATSTKTEDDDTVVTGPLRKNVEMF